MRSLEELKVGVLVGGISAERDISIKTGSAIFSALKRKGMNAQIIDVRPETMTEVLSYNMDVAFIAMHGKYGEDGTIQGFLESLGIPYTGSSVLSSALCMNKALCKLALKHYGVFTPRFYVIRGNNGSGYACKMPFPVVVKPTAEGSTIGISVVQDERNWDKAVRHAMKYDQEVLVEEFIAGKDITVGILNGRALPVVEILPKSGFYDYESKYTPGLTEFTVPAKMPEDVEKHAKQTAEKVHRIMKCRFFSRIDMRVDINGNVWVLEVNTIPGMTETSLLPMAAKEAGISFDELILKILGDALTNRFS